MQVASLSPSFNAYSNSELAGIAARVVGEFDSSDFPDEFRSARREYSEQQRVDQRGGVSNNLDPESDGDDGDFDFAFAVTDLESLSPISAGEIFQNGKIRPAYPFFDRDLLLEDVKFQNEDEKENDNRNPDTGRPRIRNPLRKLFIEERETTTTTSSSSSEADELDGATAAAAEAEVETEEDARWKKSSSASAGGDSKRWKLKNLMRRSRSAGSKNGIVLLTHTNSARKKEDETKVNETPVGGVKMKLPPYNRAGDEKRRSYLPYRQDLVGFFSNINGLRKNLKRY